MVGLDVHAETCGRRWSWRGTWAASGYQPQATGHRPQATSHRPQTSARSPDTIMAGRRCGDQWPGALGWMPQGQKGCQMMAFPRTFCAARSPAAHRSEGPFRLARAGLDGSVGSSATVEDACVTCGIRLALAHPHNISRPLTLSCYSKSQATCIAPIWATLEPTLQYCFGCRV